MDEEKYLSEFEARLQTELMKRAFQMKAMGDTLLQNDDIEAKFLELAPGYFADAVKEIAEYPEVSVAWAGYLGMGVAKLWDEDFSRCQKAAYSDFLGSRGFDDMDEHIVRDILGHPLASKEAQSRADILSRLASTAISFIRHEGVEPQSPRAYYIYARAVQVVYRIGASIQLHSLGYRYQKMEFPGMGPHLKS